MNALWLILKVITFPAWGPLWLTWKLGKFLLVLVLVSAAQLAVAMAGAVRGALPSERSHS